MSFKDLARLASFPRTRFRTLVCEREGGFA